MVFEQASDILGPEGEARVRVTKLEGGAGIRVEWTRRRRVAGTGSAAKQHSIA